MASEDRKPLADGPAADRIRTRANNRLGAVYSALYSFWTARHAAATVEQRTPNTQRGGRGAVYSALSNILTARNATARNVGARNVEVSRGHEPGFTRQDAYSVILFDDSTTNAVDNDVTSSPDELLNIMLNHQANGGTNFATALREAQAVMERHWSAERFVA